MKVEECVLYKKKFIHQTKKKSSLGNRFFTFVKNDDVDLSHGLLDGGDGGRLGGRTLLCSSST